MLADVLTPKLLSITVAVVGFVPSSYGGNRFLNICSYQGDFCILWLLLVRPTTVGLT